MNLILAIVAMSYDELQKKAEADEEDEYADFAVNNHSTFAPIYTNAQLITKKSLNHVLTLENHNTFHRM